VKARAIVAIAAAAAAVASCYRGYAIEGRLVGADGARGARCHVFVAVPTRPEGQGSECIAPDVSPPSGAGERWVPLGSAFRCGASYSTLAEELRVRCPGYAPLDVPLASCNADCDDVDLGVLLVEPLR